MSGCFARLYTKTNIYYHNLKQFFTHVSFSSCNSFSKSRVDVRIKQGKVCLNVSEKQSFHHTKKRSLKYGVLHWTCRLQYLPTGPVPVYSMEFLYNSAAEPNWELLKLPIRGYVQAKLASRRQWRKWIGAAAAELSCVGVGKDPGRNSVT